MRAIDAPRKYKMTLISAKQAKKTGFMLVLAALVSVGLPSQLSFAQSSPPLTSAARSIASQFEERGRDILGRHLATHRFQIFATVSAPAADTAPKSPYLPAGGSGPLKTLDNWTLRGRAQTVRLDIFIDPKVAGDARNKLGELLVRGLALRPTEGDGVAFTELTMVEPENQSKSNGVLPDGTRAGGDDKALRMVQDDLRALKFRTEDLMKERNDLSRDLSLAKSEIQRRAGEGKSSTTILSKPGEAEPPTKIDPAAPSAPEAKPDPMSVAWITGGAGTLLAVALLIGLLLIGGSFRSLGNSVSGAVAAIAQALENVGGALSSGRGDGTTQVDIKQTLAGGHAEGRAEAVGRGRISFENVEKRLKELKQVLTSQLSGRGETAALAQIDQLLGGPAGVELGVAMLEVLGEEQAHRLYLKLNKQRQATVLNFLKNGTYTTVKEERLLEAGDKLKMLMFVEAFGGLRGDLDGRVIEAMIRIQDSDLADVCLKLPREALPRLLSYCEPRRIARILDSVKRVDEAHYAHLVGSVTEIPEARFKTNFDDTLNDRLTQALSGADSDFQREYLEFYREIIEESGDKMRAEVTEKLSTQHPRVKEYLEERVVSFSTLFKLAREYQEEIIDYLANRDLAALLLSSDDRQKGQIQEILDNRRKDLLKDDMTRLEGRGKRQVEAAFIQAKRLVIDKIAKIKGDGLIQDLMAKPPKDAALRSAA